MSKHIIDQNHLKPAQLDLRLVSLQRQQGLHRATRKLIAQATDRAGQRVAAYARIARGRSV